MLLDLLFEVTKYFSVARIGSAGTSDRNGENLFLHDPLHEQMLDQMRWAAATGKPERCKLSSRRMSPLSRTCSATCCVVVANIVNDIRVVFGEVLSLGR